MIKFITDSTAYFTREEIKKMDIGVVPLNYILGEESGREMLPGDFNEFFETLENTKLFPTTSQPSTGDFILEYERAFDDKYKAIVAVLISSKLSGTYNSANLAKEMMEGKEIFVVDSLVSAACMKLLVKEGYEMAKEGKTAAEIYAYMNERKHEMKIFLTVESLEYLSRGGRMSSLSSMVGNLLNIKPIIELKDGSLDLLEKVRGKKKAVQKMIDLIPKDTKHITVCHVVNEIEAEELASSIRKTFPNLEIGVEELGPVIGSHVGPGGIGICIG